MKQLKRAAAVLLAVCLIFSLAACGGVNIDKTAKIFTLSRQRI